MIKKNSIILFKSIVLYLVYTINHVHVNPVTGRHFDGPLQSLYDSFALFRDERVDLLEEMVSIYKLIGDVSKSE